MSNLYATVRDAPFGQLVRLITKNRYFKYPEEQPGFQIPWENARAGEKEKELEAGQQAQSSASDTEVEDETHSNPRPLSPSANPADPEALTQIPTANSTRSQNGNTRTVTRSSTREWTSERLTAEQQDATDRTTSNVIVPTTTKDGITLVDWYTTDDDANPQNWSSRRKGFATSVIVAYTFAAYASSAIYTSSEGGIMERFNVGHTKASLGLSVYVLGYGLGPMLFSPLSEIPAIGRNPPYIITFALFVIFAVPTALSDSYGALITWRLITGFMSSPALATGGATMQDLYDLLHLPYALSAWVAAAFCAPALGPLLSGFAVMNENWRWSFWIILWLSSPVWIYMFFFLPETFAGTILLRRAQRLRKLTGNPNLKSQSEIDQGEKKFKTIAYEQLVKPMEITIKDPAVLFTNVYTACIYGIYYSFFEVFPLVYVDIYGFNLGELGLPFIGISVGCAIALAIYIAYNKWYLIPDIQAHGLRAQEHRLVPALGAVTLLPAGIFWFGWTAERSLPWIVCTIGLTLFPIGAFLVMQCLFMYLPLTYPPYAASLFAANDLFRSAMATGAILYARPLYINLGIGKGCSVLGGLLCGGCLGIWALWYFGARLRAKSRFAMS